MSRTTWIAAIGLTTASCTDLLLNDPAPAGPVTITVSASIAGTPAAQQGFGSVLEKADELAINFEPVDGDGGPFSLSVPLDFTEGEARARIEVELDRESRTFEIVLLARSEARTIFAGRVSNVVLTRGSVTRVEPTLRPQVGFVEVAPISPVSSLGDPVTIDAQAYFATGDPLPGAEFFYESLDLEILEPVHADPRSNLFRAIGEGSAEVRVTAVAGGETFDPPSSLPGTVDVEVDPVAVELEATPPSLELFLGEFADVQVTAVDANGNALDRSISFQSTNGGVAEVEATGSGGARVTGVGQGNAQIVASLGQLQQSIPVAVARALGTGDVQITLTWNNTADLDLYVRDPFGEVISYLNPTSQSGGQLDVDDLDGFGPENIFWPPGEAPGGEYVVAVDHFSGPSPSAYQVRVRVGGSEQILTGQIGSGQTVEVIRFTVEAAGTGVVRR